MTTNLTNLVRKFHSDEEGLEALQVVMIVAIAGMIMVAASTVGSQAVKLAKIELSQMPMKPTSM